MKFLNAKVRTAKQREERSTDSVIYIEYMNWSVKFSPKKKSLLSKIAGEKDTTLLKFKSSWGLKTAWHTKWVIK